MGYKNPTLTEIYAELHLESGTLSEKSFMALSRELAAQGLDDQEFMHTAVAVNQDKEGEPEAKIVARIRCWDRERTKLVQFSPDALYVNLIGEYPGWDAFFEHLRIAYEALKKALKTSIKFAQVDLVTIDTWKVDRTGFTIGQYLNCGGVFVPQWYSGVEVSSDITLGQGFHQKDGFNKKINIAVRALDNEVQFKIVASFGGNCQQGELNDLMNQLHKESLQCFESLITDKVRNEIMGGQL
jgi:uncharacterized protein (TIGR04255 family)